MQKNGRLPTFALSFICCNLPWMNFVLGENNIVYVGLTSKQIFLFKISFLNTVIILNTSGFSMDKN